MAFKLPKSFAGFFNNPVRDIKEFVKNPKEETKKRLAVVSPFLTKAGERLSVNLPETPEVKSTGVIGEALKSQKAKLDVGRILTNAVMNLPSGIIKSHGELTRKTSEGEKLGIEDWLTATDYVPGIGLYGAGGIIKFGKGVVKSGAKELAKEAGEQVVKKQVAKPIVKKVLEPTAEQIAEYQTKDLLNAKRELRKLATESPFAQEVSQIKNFLKTSAEKIGKTGELYREHVDRSLFGVSSDEVAASLGKSEKEFMEELMSEVETFGEKQTAKLAAKISTKLGKIKSTADALKLDREVYNVLTTIDNKLAAIPSYKNLRPYRTAEQVGANISPKTAGKVAAREGKARLREFDTLFDEYQQHLRNTTLSPAQAIRKGFTVIKEATDEAVRNNLKSKLGNIRWYDHLLQPFGTPSNIFKRLGIYEEAYRPLEEGIERNNSDLYSGFKFMNTWWKEIKGNKRAASTKIFKFLNGEGGLLDENELRIADEIKDYLEYWADRTGLPKEKRIANYITHVFENDKGISEELSSILKYAPTSGVFDPYLKKRYGAEGYVEDVFKALDAYVRRSSRYANLDKPLNNLAEYAKNMPEFASNYIIGTVNYVGGRPDRIENWMNVFLKSIIGNKLGSRPALRAQRMISGTIFRATLGLNLGAAVRNLMQGVNTFSTLGTKHTIQGYSDLATKGIGELKDTGALSEMMHAAYETSKLGSTLREVDQRVFFKFFETAEQINRGAAYWGAKAKGLAEGMREEEAIKYALGIVKKTQFGYGKADTPAILRSPLAKVAFQYSTYPLKQGEFVLNMVKEKKYAELTRFIVGSFVAYQTMGRILNLKPKDLLNVIPSLGPLPDTLHSAYQAATGDKTEQEKLKKSWATFSPAGTQTNTTITAAEGLTKGEYRTKPSKTYPAGKLQFQAPKTLAGKVQALLLGKWSSPEADEYIAKLKKQNPSLFDKIWNAAINQINFSEFFKQPPKQPPISPLSPEVPTSTRPPVTRTPVTRPPLVRPPMAR